MPLIHQIDSFSLPVLSHMDWDLSNVVLHLNLDGVAGVIDWERTAFFPRGWRECSSYVPSVAWMGDLI